MFRNQKRSSSRLLNFNLSRNLKKESTQPKLSTLIQVVPLRIKQAKQEMQRWNGETNETLYEDMIRRNDSESSCGGLIRD